jgi:ethanolamine kinase
VLQVKELHDVDKGRLVAQRLARWHRVTVPGEVRQAKLFPTLHKWLNELPTVYSQHDIQAKFEAAFTKEELARELSELESALDALKSPVVFCHNDLLHANILYDEQTDSVAFIDYEYGCYNHRGFDLGNHFAEWAGFECDYTQYPDHKQQSVWLRTYLQASYPSTSPLCLLYL